MLALSVASPRAPSSARPGNSPVVQAGRRAVPAARLGARRTEPGPPGLRGTSPAPAPALAWAFDRIAVGAPEPAPRGRTPSASAPPGLLIGRTDDPAERQADAIAQAIMQPPRAAATITAAPGRVSRLGDAGGAPVAPMVRRSPASLAAPPGVTTAAAVRAATAAPGQTLDAASRGFFEPHFGHDFAAVRIHHDATAGASAERLDARAYTLGRDIVFAPGQYQPASRDGQRLLAHELAHVVQQRDGAPVLRRQPAPGPARSEPDEPLDQALARDAVWDAIGQDAQDLGRQVGAVLQRIEAQQEAAADEQAPFYVKENPRLRQLKAALEQDRQRLPGEVATARKELIAAERAYLKSGDELDALDAELRALGVERASLESAVPVFFDVLHSLVSTIAAQRDAAAKDVDAKLAAIRTLQAYIAEQQAYVLEKERFLREMREQATLQGLSAARRAGVSSDTPLPGQPAAQRQTVTLLQTMIEASRLLEPYVGSKRAINLRAPGRFEIDDADAFERAKKAAHIQDPEPGAKIGGFYDRAHDTIHLPQSAEFGDALHEAIHRFSAPVLRNICFTLNEGFTQYVTDAVLREQGLPKLAHVAYDKQVACATKLIHQYGFDTIARLYFAGTWGAAGLLESVRKCDDYC